MSLNEAAVTAAWAANVGIGLGLVGVGVGTYLVVTANGPKSPPAAAATREPARTAVRVVPLAGPGGAGIAVGGSW